MRDKFMPFDEFASVQQYNWAPVELKDGAWPKCLQNIPKEKVDRIVASGYFPTGILLSGSQSSGVIVGGIDVIRHSPDDPVPYNKDCNRVISGLNPSGLTVQNLPNDSEHWLSELPKRYSSIPTVKPE